MTVPLRERVIDMADEADEMDPWALALAVMAATIEECARACEDTALVPTGIKMGAREIGRERYPYECAAAIRRLGAGE